MTGRISVNEYNNNDAPEALYIGWQNAYDDPEYTERLITAVNNDEQTAEFLRKYHLSEDEFAGILASPVIPFAFGQTVYGSDLPGTFIEKLSCFGLSDSSRLFIDCVSMFFTYCKREDYLDADEDRLADIVGGYTRQEFKTFLINLLSELSLKELKRFGRLPAVLISKTGEAGSEEWDSLFAGTDPAAARKYRNLINIFRIETSLDDDRAEFWEKYEFADIRRYSGCGCLVMECGSYYIAEFTTDQTEPLYIYGRAVFESRISRWLSEYPERDVKGRLRNDPQYAQYIKAHDRSWQREVKNYLDEKETVQPIAEYQDRKGCGADAFSAAAEKYVNCSYVYPGSGLYAGGVSRLDSERFEGLLNRKSLNGYCEACRLLVSCGLPKEMRELYEELIRRLTVLRDSAEENKSVYQPDMYQFREYYIPEALRLTAVYADYLEKDIGRETVQETEREIIDALEKLVSAVDDVIDEIYRYASIETRAQAMALENIMGRNGYTDEAELTEEEKRPEEPAAGLPAADVPAAEETVGEEAAAEMLDAKMPVRRIPVSESDTSDILTEEHYGADSQKGIATISSAISGMVGNRDYEEIGSSLRELRDIIESTSVPEKKGLVQFFRGDRRKQAENNDSYKKAESDITRIENDLHRHQQTLIKDAYVLEQMYDMNLAYYKELTRYIAAGRKTLETEAGRKALEETAGRKAIESAAASEPKYDRLKRRILDLETTRLISMQMAPQIRLLQSADRQMADKLRSDVFNTITAWRNGMSVRSAGQKHENDFDIMKSVDDAVRVHEEGTGILARAAEKLKKIKDELRG